MRISIFLLFAVLVSGCSTTYHKQSFTGGYSEKKLSPFEYAINFSGNGYTSNQKVSDLALLRASEIATNKGFNYFILTNSSVNIDSSTRIHSGNYISTGIGTGFSVGSSTAIHKPNGNLQAMFFVNRPWTLFDVYEADDIERKIKEKYQIKSIFNSGQIDIDEIKGFYQKNALKNINNNGINGYQLKTGQNLKNKG